jgi:hypothetical protein
VLLLLPLLLAAWAAAYSASPSSLRHEASQVVPENKQQKQQQL